MSTLHLPPEPELDLLAARVDREGYVDLGEFDEAELLAIGISPLARVRFGNNDWPQYVGLAGDPETLPTAAVDHPEVQAGGSRLAERGQAVRATPSDQAPAGWLATGSARSLALLSTSTSSGSVQWFSGPVVKAKHESPPAGVNGGVNFSRWGQHASGICFVKSVTVRGDVTADTPLVTEASAASPEIAAQHVVEAVFRAPLTMQERENASGTHCRVVLAFLGRSGLEAQSLDFWHTWDAEFVFRRQPGSGQPRQGLFTSRKDILDKAALLAGITKAAMEFVQIFS